MLFSETNNEMYDNIRPRNWVDPVDTEYDMVVIGGGAGGMYCAGGSAIMGAKVAMIERGFFGGDCLVTGCVPSKAFLKACNVAHTCKTASNYGVEITGEIKINFPALMERMKKIRTNISYTDCAEKFSRVYGVNVFLGHAEFTSPKTLLVNGKELKFKKVAICTGAKPIVPQIEGIETIKYYTSENIFNMMV